MATTADFLRLLREDPEFRAEVRRELLTQELIELPEKFAAFVAQTRQEFSDVKTRLDRLEGTVGELEGTVARLDGTVGELEGTVARLDGTVGGLQGTVGTLNGTVGGLQGTVGGLQGTVGELQGTVGELQGTVGTLNGTVGGLEGTVGRLDGTVGGLEGTVGRLNGREYERHVSRTLTGVVSNVLGLRRGRLVHSAAFGTSPEFHDQMDTVVETDQITAGQWHELLNTDAVLRATQDGITVYAVAEISLTIHDEDINRAEERAAILQQATGSTAYAVVIGDHIPQPQMAQADAKNVRVINVQQ